MTKSLTLSGNHIALVDDKDFGLCSYYRWFYDHGYARAHMDGHKIYLHRFLTDAPKGMHVDHKNGDKLDNHQSNLRVCTENENQRNVPKRSHNTSGFKGVRYSFGKWQAYILVNKRQISLGRFIDKIEAAKAYNEGAVKYHGEFARLNDV